MTKTAKACKIKICAEEVKRKLETVIPISRWYRRRASATDAAAVSTVPPLALVGSRSGECQRRGSLARPGGKWAPLKCTVGWVRWNPIGAKHLLIKNTRLFYMLTTTA